jgi:hypothetical protein
MNLKSISEKVNFFNGEMPIYELQKKDSSNISPKKEVSIYDL